MEHCEVDFFRKRLEEQIIAVEKICNNSNLGESRKIQILDSAVSQLEYYSEKIKPRLIEAEI